jgi:hypothetical protein
MPLAAQAAYAAQQAAVAGPVANNVVQLDPMQPDAMLADPQPASRHATSFGGGLFTTPSEPQAAPHRPSLFKRATSSLRWGAAEPEQTRTEPQMGEPEPTATVRQAGADTEVAGLDIPAFLRRQH